MNHLEKQIEDRKAPLAAAQAFAVKYGDKLPEGVASINFMAGTVATCYISTGWSEADRNKALVLVGEIFGRKGWKQNLCFDRTHYDWTLTMDGVDVRIPKAERVPNEEENAPVAPSQFPLQLTDSE